MSHDNLECMETKNLWIRHWDFRLEKNALFACHSPTIIQTYTKQSSCDTIFRTVLRRWFAYLHTYATSLPGALRNFLESKGAKDTNPMVPTSSMHVIQVCEVLIFQGTKLVCFFFSKKDKKLSGCKFFPDISCTRGYCEHSQLNSN